MDNLEEQHAIIGFNRLILLNKNSLDKIDVLCENAFLLALHLPLRIDHQDIPQENTMATSSSDSNFYYAWLEKKLIQI